MNYQSFLMIYFCLLIALLPFWQRMFFFNLPFLECKQLFPFNQEYADVNNQGLNEHFLKPGDDFLDADMDSDENEILYKYMDKSSTFFEFGSGGSTHQAMKRGLTIYTVESSPPFHNLLKQDFAFMNINQYYQEHYPSKSPNITYITYDIQLNLSATRDDWNTYSRSYNHKKYHADLIYIHGNCRDATALNVYNEIDSSTFVIFQAPLPVVLDYSDKIKELLNYYELVENTACIYVFKKAKSAELISQSIIEKVESRSICYYDNLHGAVRKYIRLLLKAYHDIVISYAYNLTHGMAKPKENYVWSMWSSGEKNAPLISRECFKSMKKHFRNHKLIILDFNSTEYFSGIPSYIFEKVASNSIAFTFFSDLLRNHLIAEYGGLWVDSTIYFSGELDSVWFNQPFYTHKAISSFYAGKGRWTGFCQYGLQNGIVQKFCRDMLFAYWANNTNNHYFIYDMILCLGYRYIPIIRRLIDSVPKAHKNIYALVHNMNEPYSPKLMKEIFENGPFFKLSNKKKYETTVSGAQTIFGHLFQNEFKDEATS